MKVLIEGFCILVLGILLWSVVMSGYFFQFNADEVYHANAVYLILKGYKIFVDFYSVYSPIFYWILSPLYLLFGFNFESIYASRALMIVLMLVRLFVMTLLVKRVFNTRVSVIAAFLFLLDPFLVFAGMQIRPENIMMLFYTVFLHVFYLALNNLEHKRRKQTIVFFFISGVFCALTLLINIKILPSLAAFSSIFLYVAFRKKLFSYLLIFLNGFCLTFLAFFGYFLLKGYVTEMFLHLFIDPFRLNNAIPHPTWLGYFYFTNPTIYGIDGKPWNWMLAWVLPVIGFAGGYKSLSLKAFSEKNSEDMMKTILFFSMVLQWASMLLTNSVFIQYYIPLNWLYAVFGAVGIDELLFKNKDRPFRFVSLITIGILFFLVVKTSVRANLNRSEWKTNATMQEMIDAWKIIPEDQPVFPNVIFRPLVYPVIWGTTFVSYIRDRYQPAYTAIEKHKLKTLVNLNDEIFGALDKASQEYITTHYQKEQGTLTLWRIKY